MQTRETLDRAIADDHEAAHLRGQLDQLRSEAGAAREELARLRTLHPEEAEDIERLEGFGLAAVLRGSVRAAMHQLLVRAAELESRTADLRARRDALLTG